MTAVTLSKQLQQRITIGILLLVLIFSFYTLFGSKLIFAHFGPGITASSFFISRILIWMIVAVMYIYATKVEKLPFFYWAEKEYSFWEYLKRIVFITLTMLLASGMAANIVRLFKVYKESEKMAELIVIFKVHIVLCVFTCITAGITEECLFRGYLQPRLQLLFNKNYISVIVSAILFAGIHVGYGTVINMAIPFAIGIVFALYYQKYRNIKMLMFCHFLWDIVGMVIQIYHPIHLPKH